MGKLIYFAIPFFVISLVLEWRMTRGREDVLGYEPRDTAASLTMGIGNVVIAALVKVWAFGLWTLVAQWAVFDLPADAAWVWLAIIPCEDLCYYAFHRAHHESRFFWAAHVNHHSSTMFNLSTALRQSWTTPLTGPIFWAPLALLGFDPLLILWAQSVSLIYQFWIHTELIDRLGPLEWLLNTPSHHRVHHGRNPQYLDRNYAGILIVWDRLFGSFEPEDERVDFGLTKNIGTYDPIRIAFHEWLAIGRDVLGSGSVAEALRHVFGRPGWSPDGSTRSAPELREAWLAARREPSLQGSDSPVAAAESRG